jgi:hypothetical protein
MKTNSFKLYFTTLLLTLTLASFTFAGDGQCPIAPPPPEGGGGMPPVVTNTNPSVADTYQFLKGFWESLAQNTDLF